MKSENSILAGIILIFVVLCSFAVFGLIGLRTVLGIIILIFLPFYFLFESFDLSKEEKFFFSFFVSIMLFPSLVYWLGFIVPFRISIFVIFILLLVAGYLLKKFKK